MVLGVMLKFANVSDLSSFAMLLPKQQAAEREFTRTCRKSGKTEWGKKEEEFTKNQYKS